jgi:hypothetical protein
MMSIYDLLRHECEASGISVEDDADLLPLETALRDAGFGLSVSGSRIVAEKQGQVVSLQPALQTLSRKPELQSIFVTPIDRVSKLSQLKTASRKAQFIGERGLPAFERLVLARQ